MEKMKVLQMLEAGKITADEAANLLRAIDSPKKQATYTHTPAPGYSDSTVRHTNSGSVVRPTPTAPPVPSYAEQVNEIGRKIETFTRDMEPKIAKLTETMVEKTANVADRISKSLQETAKPAPAPSAPAHTHRPEPVSGGLSERNFELTVYPGYNELNLAAYAGDVLIKGYNGDKITARVSWRAKKGGAAIELASLGNKYYLKYDEDEFANVNIDAYIPEGMFNRVNIKTINGRVDVATLKCDYLEVGGTNAETVLKNIRSDNIKVECDNSKISLSDIYGESMQVDSFNAMVQADLIDVSKLKLSAFNGQVNVNIASFDKYNSYSWKVESNNGKLSMNIPTHPMIGYDIKARTTLSSIKMGLTGMSFISNSPTYIEAKSIDFDSAIKKIDLTAETSNAPLTIN